MKPLIDKGKIETITCEVTKNEYGNLYKNLPDNSENGFSHLLKTNYILVAKGWGILKENHFKSVPKEWWEMDCMWKLKIHKK